MPDNITFMTIPTDWRIPGAWLEIDHTRAVRGLPNMPRRVLLLGQRLTTGTVADGVRAGCGGHPGPVVQSGHRQRGEPA